MKQPKLKPIIGGGVRPSAGRKIGSERVAENTTLMQIPESIINIELQDGQELQAWGVVTATVKKFS